MQKIKKILKITGGVSEWIDERGNPANPPTIPIGANLALEIDVREALNDGMTDALPAYPIAELSADSYSFAIDGDYDHLTDPKMLKLSGVIISEGTALPDGSKRTIITATIPNTNYAGLKSALETSETIEMDGELAGHDADSVSVFVFAFPVIVRNRVWFPDDAPESVTEDPDYLNSAQVEAKIAAEVAAAVAAATAELDGADGTSNFLYVAYASDNAGADFNLTPSASLPYMAIITSATELDPPVEANFSAATWVQFIGNDGTTTTNVTGLNLSPQGDWAVDAIYAENDAARHNGAIWQSLSDSNTGNEPSEESEYWQLVLQDGADGEDAQDLLLAYNTVSTADDPGWHTTLAADDEYFRISLDGGATWTIAKQLTQSHSVIAQYNPDATSDWATASKPAGAIYSTATGAYFRVAFTGGVYGNSQAIKAGMASQVMRVQFSATGDDETTADWHAEPVEGDTYVRFYNDSGSIRMKYTIDAGGLDIVSVQLSPIDNPWHTTFASATDKYMRISTDSGSNFSTAIKVVGTDASEPQAEFSANGVDWSNSPTNAVYQRWSTDGGVTWTAAIQIKGEAGAGIQIDATGTLTERTNYDSTPLGFIYLASDGDGSGGPALFQRTSATQGVWSSAVPITPGPAGKDGKDGAAGAAATIVPDFEFTSAEMLADIDHGNYLLIDGITPIAQVELYDTAGNGVAVERGDAPENGSCMIVTRYSQQKTIIYFGELDISRGGRVRFAQGSNSSGGTALPISHQRFARPYFEAATHLVVQAAHELDFSDAETIIDTENVEADRAKAIGYTGLVLTVCPDTGFGGNFSGQPVFVDLSAITETCILRYKWVSAAGDSDWYVTFFPSNGEAYVAPPASSGGGESPTPTAFGTLKVNIAGALTGQWSVDGGSTWHDSGDTITVDTGTHTVTFAFVDGYTTPASQNVTISENTLSTVSAEYYEIEEPTETEGTLVVNITGAAGGRWSVDGGTTWKSGGQSLLLTAGIYTITFEPILGYSKPDDISTTIVAGNITVKSGAYVAQPDSADPTDYGMTWDNGTEPILGEGKKVIYVTPNGAGNFSGDSWANAKAGLYTAGLAAVSGDVLYLQEGTYSHLAPVAATKSIGIYGGFTVADGTWATRNGFDYPTVIDAGSNPSVPFIRPESGVAQAVDGVACTGFTGGVMLANGGTATVRNCAIYDCGGMVSSHVVDNCLVLNCTGGTGAATDCVFVKVNTSSSIIAGDATDCIFMNCSASTIIWGAATGCTLENCETNGQNGCIKDSAEDCAFTNCSNSSSSNSYIVVGGATNCTFTDCSSSSIGNNSNYRYSYIAVGGATNCTFTDCSSSSIGNNSNYSYYSYIVAGGGATDCTFTNCSSISGGDYGGRMDSFIVDGSAEDCTFTNCSSSIGSRSSSGSRCTIVNNSTTNCAFTNCSSGYGYIVAVGATNCTFVRCVAGRLNYNYSGYDITNCVIFGCDIDTIDFAGGTNNAASAYIDANTLVLGTNNTLAKFASLGTVETIGYSETLNNTPAEDFGDFRPMVGSVLIGAGVAVSGITEDIAGNLRPDPPTIGAYEYVEETP